MTVLDGVQTLMNLANSDRGGSNGPDRLAGLSRIAAFRSRSRSILPVGITDNIRDGGNAAFLFIGQTSNKILGGISSPVVRSLPAQADAEPIGKMFHKPNPLGINPHGRQINHLSYPVHPIRAGGFNIG